MSEAVDTVDVNELLDERAAARRLGISPRAMWGLADSGAIPFIRIGPRLKRYDPRDLADFIERNRWQRLAPSRPATKARRAISGAHRGFVRVGVDRLDATARTRAGRLREAIGKMSVEKGNQGASNDDQR
jgi:hypothetical protein